MKKNIGIKEECTVMESIKQHLMLYKIGGISYADAKEHIQAYFESELGAERTNEEIAYLLGKENKEGFIKRFKNTTDEALLYPLLCQEALLELEEMRVSDNHKKRAKGHLKRFMEEWENTRKDEVKEAQKRKKTHKSVITEQAKKYFQRAIEAGYMEETENGYKWNSHTVKWGYFIKCIYDPKNNSPIPQKALETLFNKGRLDSPLRQIMNWKSNPKWVEEMDNTLFYD